MSSLAAVDDSSPEVTAARQTQDRVDRARLEALLTQDGDLLKGLLTATLELILQAEMTEFLHAAHGVRSSHRTGYRAGHYYRPLRTGFGRIEVRVPRERSGAFSTAVFERFPRNVRALRSALLGMCLHGVSTRNLKPIVETLCGHGLTTPGLSAIKDRLTEELGRLARRPLTEPYPYLILEIFRTRVPESAFCRHAVLAAIGINWDGRRRVLAVESVAGESQSSWLDFLNGLKRRGLSGVEVALTDDDAGVRAAVAQTLAEAKWLRCNAQSSGVLSGSPQRVADGGCLGELRWLSAGRR